MNKIQKVLKAVKEIIKRPSLINLVINNDFVWNDYLKKHYPLKQTLPVIEIEDLIPEFDESLSIFSFLGGGSLPTDIVLLKALSSQIKDCSYFEIGTWRGESVVNVAEKANECYTLNLSKDEIISLGMPIDYANLHGFFSKGNDNIKHLEGDSLTYDFKSLNKKFDLIFIDGNHTYKYVKNDTDKIFNNLVHDNTIVVWHDYAYDPEAIRPEVLAGILDGIPDDKKDNLYHVSNTLCAIYTNKEFKSRKFKSVNKPNKVFKTSLKIRKYSFKN